MRVFPVLSAVSAVAVTADRTPLNRWADPNVPFHAPEITIVEPNKAYVVKLDCPGCPFAVKDTNTKVLWQQPPQENALRLQFTVDTFHNTPNPALLLNGRRILPLDPMPLNINAWQVPANITTDDMTLLWLGPTAWGVQLPLQYEHTVLRTQESGAIWIQFDVTGLPLSKTNDPRFPYLAVQPIHLEGEDRKLVQLLLRQQNETSGMFIEDVQVVARKERAQPFRMKCGRLAMVQTSFDPAKWDKYGKLGTSARLQSLVVSKTGDLWSDYVQSNMFVFSLTVLLAMGMVMLRLKYWQRQLEEEESDVDSENALLSIGYEDAPPAYANIPVIKIEEYD
ncbi:hypothetical protein CC86DRAFT_442690 [Ophiobolus disseminans]|uniref:DUF7728 domain-containing protein n=1 Tax=Ophiobolus disseminans TaxID=1469910 RepID=A0A6A7AGX7_9PLEO|nr:hypothetical protein CC86DRAFT_442690 [Ophiobolus disseminans]